MPLSLTAPFSLLLLAGFSIPHLALGDCPPPPRLDHGELTDASQTVTAFPVETKLIYQCRPGYVRMPGKNNSITCLPTNAWSEIQDFCERKDCRTPGELLNGEVHLSRIPETDQLDTLFGANATFTCNVGYRIVGRNVRTCTANGWSNAIPTCEAVICASPPSIVNGTHASSDKTEFQYKDAVTYSCSDTFTLLGIKTLFCTQYGNWSGDPPTCTVISCSDQSVANARKTSGFGSGPFKYGDSITFECNKGFTMKGQARVTCNESSSWSPALPTCIDNVAVATTRPSTTVVTKPTDVDLSASTVQTTKDHISEKEDLSASTVQTTKDHISEKEDQTTKDHISEKEEATPGKDSNEKPNGGSNRGHNGGSMMLIATVLVMKWLTVHNS